MYVDCHTHILPDVDDGARTLEDALMMARSAVAEGTTRLFATPHGYTQSYHVDPAVTRVKTAALNERLHKEGIALTVLPAMELHHAVMTEGAAQLDIERVSRGAALGYGGGARPHFLLLEFSFTQWPADASVVLRAFREAGTQIVLAHPERYDDLQRKPELLEEALSEGAWMQLTTGSILGQFGEAAERLSRAWLAAGKVHIIASDAHNTVTRPTGLRVAFERVQADWGLAAAAERCRQNAAAIWEDALVASGT